MKAGIFGNAQHQGRRAYQEDAFGFSDPMRHDFVSHAGVLAVLADGMGGMAHGGAASTTAVKAFLDVYEKKTPSMSPEEVMLRALEKANYQVLSLKERSSQGRAGTTLIAATLIDQHLHWIAVGDSRIYLFREGELTQINGDHTYAEDLEQLVLQNKMTQEEALNHPERNELTNYLGLDRLAPADISKKAMKIKGDDRILLCSDGLYKALSLQEIAKCLQDQDPQRASDTLVQQALSKEIPSQDNITVLILTPSVSDRLESTLVTQPIKRPTNQKLSSRMSIIALLLALLTLLVLLLCFTTSYPQKIKNKLSYYYKTIIEFSTSTNQKSR